MLQHLDNLFAFSQAINSKYQFLNVNMSISFRHLISILTILILQNYLQRKSLLLSVAQAGSSAPLLCPHYCPYILIIRHQSVTCWIWIYYSSSRTRRFLGLNISLFPSPFSCVWSSRTVHAPTQHQPWCVRASAVCSPLSGSSVSMMSPRGPVIIMD